ncbi:MAG: Nucleotidyltransferase domain protein [Parcubacteria group bacterium]|nr:Nucleotidyltransferase domain protein [Parcubacteria group bacterium]
MFDADKIKPQIKDLAEKHGLSLVMLFGSQVTGKTHKESDFDIAFTADKYISPRETAEILFDFTRDLKIGGDIELVNLKHASPLLLKQVAMNSILLYEKEPHLYNLFKIYALKRYMEERRFLKLRELSLNKFLQKI